MHLRQFKVSLFASVALIFSSVMAVQAQDERISKVPNLGGGQTLNECGSSFLNLSGNFGGFEVDGDTYTFPTGAESWAGTANLNADLYPLSFPSGGELRFKAEIPEGGADTSVNFKFERLPYPDTEPSFFTDNTVISGAETDYVVSVPAQDASHTFSSLLMFIVERDQPVIVRDVQVITAGDGDGDGVPDASDEFPADPAASIDSDGDGSPDAWNTCATAEDIAASTLTLDSDDDDDGTPDLQDSLPLNPYHSNPDLAAFSAAFGGAVIDGVNYSVPTGAEGQALLMKTPLYIPCHLPPVEKSHLPALLPMAVALTCDSGSNISHTPMSIQRMTQLRLPSQVAPRISTPSTFPRRAPIPMSPYCCM